ncbi:MAG: hypothetical protein GF320_07110 [Armatimonadia bacterium]|nr:hypothetical protein [Armatimonadia bacterium]
MPSPRGDDRDVLPHETDDAPVRAAGPPRAPDRRGLWRSVRTAAGRTFVDPLALLVGVGVGATVWLVAAELGAGSPGADVLFPACTLGTYLLFAVVRVVRQRRGNIDEDEADW